MKPTDYKGWAHGLKKCGYATDPRYPTKLIDIIERYQLDNLDKGVDVSYASKSDAREQGEQALAEKKQHCDLGQRAQDAEDE